MKENPLFAELSTYVLGSNDPGLFVVHAMLSDDIEMDAAKAALQTELDALLANGVTENELKKVVNKSETSMVYQEMNVLNKAQNLAFFDLLEDAKLMNQQQEKYSAVKPNEVLRLAKELLKKENCTCLNYTNV